MPSKDRIQAEMKEAKEKARGYSTSAFWLLVLSTLFLFMTVMYPPILLCLGLSLLGIILCLNKSKRYERRYEKWKSKL